MDTNEKRNAEYWHNGLGHRVSWKYGTDTDGDVDGNDKTFHFAHDERWRVVATYRESDTVFRGPKQQFVYHCAGADGMGSSSYIDNVILRDKDDNSGWTSAADGTLEQRHYFCQNWRSDVVTMVTSSGTLTENYRSTAYGVPFGMHVGDVNGDGKVNNTDTTQIQAWIDLSAYTYPFQLCYVNLDAQCHKYMKRCSAAHPRIAPFVTEPHQRPSHRFLLEGAISDDM